MVDMSLEEVADLLGGAARSGPGDPDAALLARETAQVLLQLEAAICTGQCLHCNYRSTSLRLGAVHCAVFASKWLPGDAADTGITGCSTCGVAASAWSLFMMLSERVSCDLMCAFTACHVCPIKGCKTLRLQGHLTCVRLSVL